VRVALAVLLSLAVAPWASAPARADDAARFHRTTPRAALDVSDGVVVIGVPAGRAWGIESELRPLPATGATLVVRLAVSDAAVREAFVRVAYYASSSTRTRQLATADSAPVEAGARVLVAVPLDPPPGAVAYRVRVLARLSAPDGRSADDAVRGQLHLADGARPPAGSLLSRLVP